MIWGSIAFFVLLLVLALTSPAVRHYVPLCWLKLHDWDMMFPPHDKEHPERSLDYFIACSHCHRRRS